MNYLVKQNSLLQARQLGYLGLLPFILSSAFIWLPEFQNIAVKSLSVYAAMILTFIGGVHWGIALKSPQLTDSKKNNSIKNQFIFSTIPSLLAWATIVFLQPFALFILAIGFALFWQFEKSLYQQYLPNWYLQLRNRLTLIVCLFILIGWIGTLLI
ncbi:MAG: DUF3429 domain-containing protein [Pseudomonadota bacterium]